jgi:hypothetical protein
MPPSDVPEGMVKLAHALVETPHLRSWFYSLEQLSDSLRQTAFSQMAAQMRNAAEDADLSDAVAMLAQPRMYETVLAAVRERVDEASRHT